MVAAGFNLKETTAAQIDIQTISLNWEIFKAVSQHNVSFGGIL
jgi:hypothetical protein